MNRRARNLLALVPAALVAAALGVWLWHTLGSPADQEDPGRSVRTETRSASGVNFEIEYEPQEPVSFAAVEGRESIAFTRGREWLDFEDGVLAVNGVAFRTPPPGSVVRWNLTGPLLINGKPQEPHPFQPRQIDPPGTDLRWDIRGGSPAPRDTLSVAWSRTGALLTAHGDGTVRLWNPDRNEALAVLATDPPKEGPGPWGVRADLSPGGGLAVSANLNDERTTLWELGSRKRMESIPGPGKVNEVRFLSDDWLLESRGRRLQARALPPDRDKLLDLGPVHADFNPPIAVDAATWTVARNDGRQVVVFRLVPLIFTLFEVPLGRIDGVSSSGCSAVAPGGQMLAVFNGGRTLALHDTASGKVIRRLRWRTTGGEIQITAMAFSPDGKTLAVADTRSLRLYDVDSVRERCWVSTGWIRTLAYSPDGKVLAAGLRSGTGVRLWETIDLWAKTP